MPHSLLLMDHK